MEEPFVQILPPQEKTVEEIAPAASDDHLDLMTDPLQEEVTEEVTMAEEALEEDQATEVEVDEEEEEVDTAAEMVDEMEEEMVDVEEDVQKAAAEDTTEREKIKLGVLFKDIALTAKAAIAAQLDCNSINLFGLFGQADKTARPKGVL